MYISTLGFRSDQHRSESYEIPRIPEIKIAFVSAPTINTIEKKDIGFWMKKLVMYSRSRSEALDLF